MTKPPFKTRDFKDWLYRFIFEVLVDTCRFSGLGIGETVRWLVLFVASFLVSWIWLIWQNSQEKLWSVLWSSLSNDWKAWAALLIAFLISFLLHVFLVAYRRESQLQLQVDSHKAARESPVGFAFDAAKHVYRFPNGGKCLYRLLLTNLTVTKLEGVNVKLISTEPLSGDIDQIKEEIHRIQNVPLLLTHDHNFSNPQKTFSLGPAASIEVDVISIPDRGAGANFHIQHCVEFAVSLAGEPERNPDPRIPRGKYRLTVQVSGDTFAPQEIAIIVDDSVDPCFIPDPAKLIDSPG